MKLGIVDLYHEFTESRSMNLAIASSTRPFVYRVWHMGVLLFVFAICKS